MENGCPTNQLKLTNTFEDLQGVQKEGLDIFNTKRITGNLGTGTKQSVTAEYIENAREKIALAELNVKIKNRRHIVVPPTPEIVTATVTTDEHIVEVLATYAGGDIQDLLLDPLLLKDRTYTIIAVCEDGYEIDSFTIDGEDFESGTPYTATADFTLDVTSKQIIETVTATITADEHIEQVLAIDGEDNRQDLLEDPVLVKNKTYQIITVCALGYKVNTLTIDGETFVSGFSYTPTADFVLAVTTVLDTVTVTLQASADVLTVPATDLLGNVQDLLLNPILLRNQTYSFNATYSPGHKLYKMRFTDVTGEEYIPDTPYIPTADFKLVILTQDE